MKKLFIAAMALAAMVSCSKETEPTLDSSKKSVSIKIENLANGTRGVTTPSQTTNYAVAGVEDLYVAFCDATGTIVGGTQKLNGGSTENTGAYTFHGLPETVTQFFVFGNDNGTLTSYASLSAAEEAWNNSPTTQEDAEIKDVIVLGKSGTITYVKDCVDPGNAEVKYQLFEGSAKVIPNVARVEVLSIGCSDLGARDQDGNTTTLGFDKLDLTTIKLGSMDENLAGYSLEANVVDGAVQPVSTSPADGEVWSWNFAGGNVANYPLALTLDATSDAYNVTDPTRTIIATTYSDENGDLVESFEKSNVYKMNVVVTEKNLLGNDTNICVAVTVTIGEWVINNVTPNFGN